MTAAKVRISQFTGFSKVQSRESDGLAALVRGLAIDNARRVIEVAAVADLTDNSTGVPGAAGAAYAAVPVPAVAIDATSAGGAQTTALNTSLGKTANALQVLTQSVNNAAARLGLPLLVNAYGTQAAANTVPAQDLSGAGATGGSAADFASTVNALNAARANFNRVAHAMNDLSAAIGEPRLSRSALGSQPQDLVLVAIPAVVSSTAGPSAAALADVTAFLAALGNDIATLAQKWNFEMVQASTTVVTDSTGGAPAAALVADANPAAASGAATTSAPKTAFDAQLVAINDAIAQLTLKTNIVLNEYDLAPLVNNTGVTALDSTLDALGVTLSAVDGSTSGLALDNVTAFARMATIRNNLSSLGAKLNLLAPSFGVPSLGADALGGAVSGAIAAVAATAAAVGGGVNDTILNTAVNTWLSTNRNNISTLAALLNTMLGSSAPAKGLHVVAQ